MQAFVSMIFNEISGSMKASSFFSSWDSQIYPKKLYTWDIVNIEKRKKNS
jgi:hypothetical protein